MKISPIVRQALVATSSQLAAISMGGSFGYPSVLLQQFKEKDSILHPDLDTTTWIISTYAIAGMPSIFMPNIMQLKGRRLAFTASCLALTIGWLLTFLATSTTSLIVGQVFSGLGSNCVIIVNLITVSEMIAPKYRSLAMMMLGVNQCLGMTGVSVLGIFFSWKTVALVMSFPVFIAMVMVIVWTESPSWLAFMGEYDDCEQAFKWLRGVEEESLRELQALINAQKERQKHIRTKNPVQAKFQNLLNKDFYVPICYMFLILSSFYMSGAAALYIYAQHIMEEGTMNPSAAFKGNVFRDIFLVVGSCIALTLVKYFEPKYILLFSTFGSMFSLFCCFLVNYLQFTGLLAENSLLFLYSFCLYFGFCFLGQNYISCTLSVEVIPVKHRGLGGFLFSVYACIMQTISAKLFTYMTVYFHIWGTFTIFIICGVIGGTLIWIFVPKTKNLTLQEIEDYYNNDKVSRMVRDENVLVPIIVEETSHRNKNV